MPVKMRSKNLVLVSVRRVFDHLIIKNWYQPNLVVLGRVCENE